MRASLTLALALAGLLAGARTARACSCMQISARDALEAADAVFEGRVIEVRPDGDDLRVRFAVVQYWKDADTEEIEVTTASNSAACGVGFEPETSWLVYATRSGGGLTTGLCSRTARIEDAANDLEVLEAGVVPVDIGPDDEVEDPAPRAEPSQAGCASCAVGAARSPGGLAWLIAGLLAACAVRRRRRP